MSENYEENDSSWSDMELLSRTAGLVAAASTGDELELAKKYQNALSEQNDPALVAEALSWMRSVGESGKWGIVGGMVLQTLESIESTSSD